MTANNIIRGTSSPFRKERKMTNTLTEEKFIPLTRDFMFKRIFTNNPEILKKFLISVLKLDINPDLATITILNNELTKAREKEYHKTVDIYARINNNLRIDIEVNSEKFNTVKVRNTFYLNKITVDTTDVGVNYKDFSKIYFYQLNLNIQKCDKDLDEEYEILSTKNHKKLLDNYKIVCKSLDYYNELYYNQDNKLSEDIIWLSLLNASSLDELKEIAGFVMNDKEKEKFVSDCEDACKDVKWLSEWKSDFWADVVRHNVLENVKNEGLKEGIEQKETEMIKGMLKKNIDLKTISEIAGISIDKIKKIEKELK